MKTTLSPKIYLAPSTIPDANRGVFAAVDIVKDEVIETPTSDYEHLKATKLRDYYFMWGDDEQHKRVAICLGFGSLYNHSYEPNATYQKHLEQQINQRHQEGRRNHGQLQLWQC